MCIESNQSYNYVYTESINMTVFNMCSQYCNIIIIIQCMLNLYGYRGGSRGGGFVGLERTPLQLYYHELHVCSTVASYRIYLQKY